ncbi:hypothetical protein GSI_14825 [Ganoderma sinense ZZ0214-1]|uniref:Uncharacterized protein n=1 Tax=Ganoderma sinense ZZ0214-1 TaxID=1077348 RepID=A0A2G8RPT1_9APHY|nr:hypothetical protein GSI_14825 [Ganoderma sinense ZZ0214-1]
MAACGRRGIEDQGRIHLGEHHQHATTMLRTTYFTRLSDGRRHLEAACKSCPVAVVPTPLEAIYSRHGRVSRPERWELLLGWKLLGGRDSGKRDMRNRDATRKTSHGLSLPKYS